MPASMRNTLRSIITYSLLALLCACHPKEVQWVKYTSKTDGFTAYFPAEPKATTKQEKTAFGQQTVHYLTWAPETFDINKLKLLQVSYTDCPRRASADSMMTSIALDSSINLLKKDYSDADIPSETITIEGYPGRAFIYDNGRENSTAIVKQVLANDRIYTLVAVTKKDYPTNDELNKFFDSFLVLR